jgi:hypothetical protein
MPHVEQELLTFLEHLSSHPVFSGVRVARSLVFCVVFCTSLFFLFFFFNCIGRLSAIYGFWLPLWCLQIFLWYITCFIGVNKIWDSWLYLTFYTLHNILVIWRFDTRGFEHNWWDDYIKTIENPHCKSEGK